MNNIRVINEDLVALRNMSWAATMVDRDNELATKLWVITDLLITGDVNTKAEYASHIRRIIRQQA